MSSLQTIMCLRIFQPLKKTNEVCPNFNTIFKNAYDVTAFVSSLNFILKQGRKINVSFERWSYSSNELDLHRKEIEEKIKKIKKMLKQNWLFYLILHHLSVLIMHNFIFNLRKKK